ncbi:hypothetical protein ACLK1U_24490 [Escherichia coli]
MYEYMAEFKPVHVMQLPNSVKDDARVRYGKPRCCACKKR